MKWEHTWQVWGPAISPMWPKWNKQMELHEGDGVEQISRDQTLPIGGHKVIQERDFSLKETRDHKSYEQRSGILIGSFWLQSWKQPRGDTDRSREPSFTDYCPCLPVKTITASHRDSAQLSTWAPPPSPPLSLPILPKGVWPNACSNLPIAL